MNTPASSEATVSTRISFPWNKHSANADIPGSLISYAIVRHSLRKYWPIALIGSAILLIFGPVLTLLVSNTQTPRSYVIESLLNDQNFGFLAYQVLAPIIVAIAVFSYLDSSGRVAMVHSMPLTRNALFRSNVVSGLVLIFVPQIVLTITLIPFVRFGFSGFTSHDRGAGFRASVHYSDAVAVAGSTEGASNQVRYNPDLGDLLRWFIVASVIMVFIYSLTVLAAILSGNVGVAALVSVLLNGIVPGLYVLTVSTLGMFLYGFSYSTYRYMSWMHPLLDLWLNSGGLSLGTTLLFIVVSLIVLYVSAVLYRRFKSERAGSHITFEGFNLIATVLTTFVGSCLAGLILESLAGSYSPVRPHHGLFFLGVALGAPVVFAITSMTLCGTVHIFNMSSLKRFGAFAVVAVLFFSLTSFDVTGYERRLPDQQSITAVTIPTINLMSLPYAASNSDSITLSDAQSISDARALHEEIVSKANDPKYNSLFTGSDVEDSDTQSSSATTADVCQHCNINEYDVLTVEFTYRMHSGSSMERKYTVYQKYLTQSAAYHRLINDAGYRKANSLRSKGYNNIQSSQVTDAYSDNGSSLGIDGLGGANTSLGAADARTLAKLLDEDYQALPDYDVTSNIFGYDSQTGNAVNKRLLIGISFQMEDKNYNSIGPVFYGITDEYTRTINWLKDKGLYQTMVATTAKLMNAH
ncbi:MAG: hypothetical protein LKF38_05620 [Bifidobacterium sp.]|nr:hypothetical protein [Bifidobacterium sp.]